MTKTATKTETRTLACHLMEHELVERGTELVENYKEIADLDMQKKRIAARIKLLDERIEQLVMIIDTKTEERQVKCHWAYTWSEGIKRLFREDTYDIVCEEVIKEWERQQSFNIVEEVEGGVVCPKCEGDGIYYEDGIEDGGGEVFCDCPAGIKAKEENEPTDPVADDAKDGVTPEKVETIQVELPEKIKNYRAQIHLAKGDSGSWYSSIHLHTPTGGNGSYLYPTFSPKHETRFTAIDAAANQLWERITATITDKKIISAFQGSISTLLLLAAKLPVCSKADCLSYDLECTDHCCTTVPGMTTAECPDFKQEVTA